MIAAAFTAIGASLAFATLGVVADPELSRAVNTLLNLATLIFVWFVQRSNTGQSNDLFSKVDKVHNDVVHAASAAASAAEAASESARVIKDIGSTLRSTDTPTLDK